MKVRMPQCMNSLRATDKTQQIFVYTVGSVFVYDGRQTLVVTRTFVLSGLIASAGGLVRQYAVRRVRSCVLLPVGPAGLVSRAALPAAITCHIRRLDGRRTLALPFHLA